MKAAKRFYKTVSVNRLEDQFGVTLDDRQLKTPGNQILRVASEKVAGFIAAEWDAQIDDIRPETMPVTRLVNVSIELTPDNRDALAEEARKYAGTDLLCYRASEPVTLSQRQAEKWDPILSWAAKQGIALKTTPTVRAIDQDPEALSLVSHYASGLSDLSLTLMVHLTAVYGSAILAFAVMKNHLTGLQAFELSRLDNLYQIEHWGEDEEAAENAENLAREVQALCQILE